VDPSPLRSGSWDSFEPMSASIANGVSMLTPRGYDRRPPGGFGMEYSVRRGWVLRAGAQLNRSDLPDSFRDFQGVDERTRVGFGLSYSLSPRVELDLAYLYALSERESEMQVQAPSALPFASEMRSSASEGIIGVTLRYRF
jgi:long-subunit fatty acid transport protein